MAIVDRKQNFKMEEQLKVETEAQLLSDMIHHANSFKCEMFPKATLSFTEEELQAQLQRLKLSVLNRVGKFEGEILTPTVTQGFDTWFRNELEPEVTYVNDKRRRLFNTVEAELDRKFGGIESRVCTKHDFEAFMQVYMEDTAVDKVLLNSLGPEWALLYQELKTTRGRWIWNCLQYVQMYEVEMMKKLTENKGCNNDVRLEIYHNEVIETLPELSFDDSAGGNVLKEKALHWIREVRKRLIQVMFKDQKLDKKCLKQDIKDSRKRQPTSFSKDDSEVPKRSRPLPKLETPSSSTLNYANPVSEGLGLYISETRLHYAVGSKSNSLSANFELYTWIGEPHSNPRINDAKFALNLLQLLTHPTATRTAQVFTIDSKLFHPYAEEIAAVQLTNLRHTLERSCRARLANKLRVAIAVPATVTSGGRRRFKTACAMAKLEDVLLVQPTTAISVSYTNRSTAITPYFIIAVFIKYGLVEASVFKICDDGFCSSRAIQFHLIPELGPEIAPVVDQVQSTITSAVEIADCDFKQVSSCVIVPDVHVDQTSKAQRIIAELQNRFAKNSTTDHINVIPEDLNSVLTGLSIISKSRDPARLYWERYPWTIQVEFQRARVKAQDFVLVEGNTRIREQNVMEKVMLSGREFGDIAQVNRQDSTGTFCEVLVQRSKKSTSKDSKSKGGVEGLLKFSIDSEGLIQVSDSLELKGGGAITTQSYHMPSEALKEGRERLRLILESHSRMSKGKNN